MPAPAAYLRQPVESIAGDPSSGLLILCDHAANAVPPDLHDLGLERCALDRHIGYDIGAATIVRTMAGLLNAPAVLTTFSRLVIDPNRGQGDPTLVMKISDGAIVPGNARLSAGDVMGRIERFRTPYDEAIVGAIETGIERGAPPVLISIHSFTPCWKGRARPWHVGVLWDEDERLSRPLIEAFRRDETLVVGENEPYRGGLPGDTIDRHATRRGLPGALIEIRQDLIGNEEDARRWGVKVAGVVREVLGSRR